MTRVFAMYFTLLWAYIFNVLTIALIFFSVFIFQKLLFKETYQKKMDLLLSIYVN